MIIEIGYQVVCRELSQEIKNLGVKQESAWYWNMGMTSVVPSPTLRKYKISCENKYEYISALTIAEIGQLFPSYDSDYGIYIFCDCGQWFVQYRKHGFGERLKDCNNEYLVNAMAKMLIWLIKQKKVDVTRN